MTIGLDFANAKHVRQNARSPNDLNNTPHYLHTMKKVENKIEHSIQDITQKFVKKGYSHKHVIDAYTKETEIWPSEKLIFDKCFYKPGMILDVGCGAGRTSFELAKRGHKVVGIDLSQALIDRAKERALREKVSITFKVMNALKLAFRNNYFSGAIFSYNGIGFIPRKEGKLKFLKGIYRVLKPNAYFFFNTHNIFALNKYFPIHLKQFLKITFAKVLSINIREKEYGEKYDDTFQSEALYIDIKTRKTMTELIRKSGLNLIYFNSKRGIEQNRPFSILKDYFGVGNYLFYICQKPSKIKIHRLARTQNRNGFRP